MNSKKVFFLTYDGLLDSLGQSQILPYVLGINNSPYYRFTIISFEKKNKKQKIYKLKNLLFKEDIIWIPQKYNKTPPILSTIFDIIRLYLKLKLIHKKNPIDLIHARSYIMTLVAYKLNKKFKIPFIFDMRGFYPDERVDGKIWNLNNYFYHLIYSFFKKKEKQFLQSSEINISLTKNAKKEIISWNLKNLSPFEIIPCCTDFNLFNQKTKNMRNELGIKEKDFVISYVGSLGTWYMLDEMLLFFKSFIKINKNVKFLFITKENKNMILSSAKKHDISLNDIIVTASERVNVPSYINSSDISIFFILPCYSKKASSPTKMGEIMSLGIPIVCNKGVGDVDDIMSSCMPNLLVNNFSEDEFNRVIKKIINNDLPSKIKIKKYAEDNLSLHIGVKKYLKTYNKILLK